MKKKIIFTLSLLGLLVSFVSFVFVGNAKAADHCLETKDCNKNNSYPEKGGYLDGCSWYNVTGTFIVNYSCTPEGAIVKTCPEGQHLENSGPFGAEQCVYNDTEAAVNNSSTVSPDNRVLCDNGTGISTAIGCIHALGDQNAFLSDLLKWATGIGGGIAFVLMLYAGFMIMTASGNPERLKAGQELLTSAIAGLILLIFSVFILKFIGIDILGLDKFGFGSSS